MEYTADMTSLSELIHNPTMHVENDVLLSIMKNIADGTFSVHTRSWVSALDRFGANDAFLPRRRLTLAPQPAREHAP